VFSVDPVTWYVTGKYPFLLVVSILWAIVIANNLVQRQLFFIFDETGYSKIFSTHIFEFPAGELSKNLNSTVS
jgi:hypothetical protein